MEKNVFQFNRRGAMNTRPINLSHHAVLLRYRQRIGSISTNIATLEVWQVDDEHREQFVTSIELPLAGPGESEELQSMIRQAGEENIHCYIVDFSMVKWLNSLGLGFILQLKKLIAADGGHVVFANMSSRIHNLVRMSKLEHEFPAFDSIREAHRHVDTLARNEAAGMAGEKETRYLLIEGGGHFWKRRLVVTELDPEGRPFEIGRYQLHPSRLHPDLWNHLVKISQFQRLHLILDVGHGTIFQTWMGVYLDQLARLAVFSSGTLVASCRSKLLREQLQRLELEVAVEIFATVEEATQHVMALDDKAVIGR
jgi:anti-anti-sigma factor